MSRSRVLNLYRRILQEGKSWVSREGDLAARQEEARYIIQEAQSRFRENRYLPSEQVDDAVREAELRLYYASHYGIPYERLHNVDPEYVPGVGSLKRPVFDDEE
mmetsp:Transcript_8783/g.15149  ORF Transcript_8783/g.15149 Transcript_8783/m.15149 type:complete len:104 (-) Transcript_8783:1156-1467(-)